MNPFSYVDVNECSSGGAGCAHLCTNTEGSYSCSCRIGFQLNSDQRTCSGKGMEQ